MSINHREHGDIRVFLSITNVNAHYAQKERTSILDRVINFNTAEREDRRIGEDNDVE